MPWEMLDAANSHIWLQMPLRGRGEGDPLFPKVRTCNLQWTIISVFSAPNLDLRRTRSAHSLSSKI